MGFLGQFHAKAGKTWCWCFLLHVPLTGLLISLQFVLYGNKCCFQPAPVQIFKIFSELKLGKEEKSENLAADPSLMTTVYFTYLEKQQFISQVEKPYI